MSSAPSTSLARPWMKWALLTAGAYNALWGAWMILFPQHIFTWLDLPPLVQREASFWQCIGMIVGVYGVGYAIAAYDPMRHWPVVLVGWLGKVLGPIGLLHGGLTGTIPWRFGAINLFNDLIWWIPFTLILVAALREAMGANRVIVKVPFDEIVKQSVAPDGKSLLEHSMAAPLVLIFLRHLGCTFCREAVAEAAAGRSRIEAAGAKLAFVYMDTPKRGEAFFATYGLGDAPRFSDPRQALYNAFELRRAGWWQILNPMTMVRYIGAMFSGHGVSVPTTDALQMPGAFLYHRGKIVKSFRHKTVSDRPDYCALSTP